MRTGDEVIDDGAGHVDGCRPFEVDEPRCRIDLADHNSILGREEINAADPKADSPGGGHRHLNHRLVGDHRRHIGAAGGVGSPLAIGGLELGRRNNLGPDDQQAKAAAARLVVLLDHDLVTQPPQGIQNPFAVIHGPAQDHADTHPRPALFHHDRKSEVVFCRRCQLLRIGPSQGLGHGQPRCRQGPNRRPVVPSDADRRCRVRGCGPLAGDGFKHRQKTIGPPIADPSQDHIRSPVEESVRTTHDISTTADGQGGGVDKIERNTRLVRRLDKAEVAGGIGPGAENEDLHIAMVLRSVNEGDGPGILLG